VQQLLLVAEQGPPLSVHWFVQVPYEHQLPVQQSSVVRQVWLVVEHVGFLQMLWTQLRP
jgi:hypothetical protein